MRYLAGTGDSISFSDVLKNAELTDADKQYLADNAKLKKDGVMKKLFSEKDLVRRCLENRDTDAAESVWSYTWDKGELEALRDLCKD